MTIDGLNIVFDGVKIHVAWVAIGILFLAYMVGAFVANKRGDRATKKWYVKYKKDLEEAIHEKSQLYPWMAQQFADLLFMFDEEIAAALRWKKRPARKAAEDVAAIAREKRALTKQNKSLEYQLGFYEHTFPWLEEFKEIDPKEAWNYARNIDDDGHSEYDQLKNWLSPEEYQKLHTAEKYQLALERYCARKKTNWEIGIDFERYVGFKLEEQGFKVKYQGATLGLEDMGRDLIATDGKTVLVIQCKRWAQVKTIHEKHIFQLYGSVVLLANQNPGKTYKGVFITTTVLSEVARRCADYLGIECTQRCEVYEYPMIKCNVGKNGDKIYHLPFDQQYDKVEIFAKTGACYVWTVSEAEKLGFRRAYRWNPNKQGK